MVTLIDLILSSVFVFGFHAQQDFPLQSGSTIYYSSESNSQGRDIYRMDANGNGKKKLTRKTGQGHYPHNINPKVSPDGSTIVYQSDPDRHDRYTIWTMNTDGSNPRKITEEEGMYPNWHPDGKTIVFSGRRSGVWEILTIPKEGGKEEIISYNKRNGKNPGWGAVCSIDPSGKSMVYSYIREKVLYKMDLETRESKRLSPVRQNFMHPIFSKDGSRIAVNRKVGTSYDLITISPEGKEEKIIAKNVISYSSPSWSNSDSELLFTGMVNGSQEIFKINLTSRKETQLTSNADFDAMPSWK